MAYGGRDEAGLRSQAHLRYKMLLTICVTLAKLLDLSEAWLGNARTRIRITVTVVCISDCIIVPRFAVYFTNTISH